LPSDDKKTITRVIKYLRKSLADLSEVLQETVDSINEFSKSLKKAEDDVKGIKLAKQKTVSTSSTKLAPEEAVEEVGKQQAASTLFSLLAGSPEEATAAASSAPQAAAPQAASPPTKSGPPSGPPTAGSPTKSGPPSGPPTAGPPTKSGPTSKTLPPPPKLPPSGGAEAAAPGAAGVKPPSFMKKPGAGPPTAGPPSAGPPKPPGGGAAAAPAPGAAKAGGSLSTLRDEMLEELTRLKKIMRGE
jgi:hypothetical protein